MSQFIYCLVHYVDGVQIPFYVGRTNDLERRFNEHRYNLDKKDKADSKSAYKAAYDYIKKNCLCEIFEMELLHTCTGTRPIDTEASAYYAPYIPVTKILFDPIVKKPHPLRRLWNKITTKTK